MSPANANHPLFRKRGRATIAGIGSDKWQRDTGHTVNARGVPIPTRSAASKTHTPCGSKGPQGVTCNNPKGHSGAHADGGGRKW